MTEMWKNAQSLDEVLTALNQTKIQQGVQHMALGNQPLNRPASSDQMDTSLNNLNSKRFTSKPNHTNRRNNNNKKPTGKSFLQPCTQPNCDHKNPYFSKYCSVIIFCRWVTHPPQACPALKRTRRAASLKSLQVLVFKFLITIFRFLQKKRNFL